MKPTLYFFLAFFIFPAFLFAQVSKDTLPRADAALTEMHTLLQKSEHLRIQDSIRVSALNEELGSIKNSQKAQQQKLLAELEIIRNQDSLRVRQQKQAIDALRSKTKGVLVILLYDTLFTIYAALGSFDAQQRAHNAAERIEALYEDPSFNKDSLKVVAQYGILNICYGSETISSVSSIDGLWVNGDVDSLANAYTRLIGTKVTYLQQAYSFKNIMIRLGYAGIVLVVLLSILWLIRFFFRKIKQGISAGRIGISKGIRFKNYQLFSPEYVLAFILQILNFVKVLAMLLAVYLALTFMFSIFPSTRAWTQTLLGWIWQPVRKTGAAIFHYLPNLFTIIVIILIARFVARIFRFFSIEIERGVLNIRGFHKDWARPTYNIVRFFFYAFAFVVIFPYLPGSGSDAFKGVSVFLGILFSIGSSSAISNTIAGFVITYMRPFKVGDWIKVNDVTGYVVEKTVLVTRIRTIHNEDVTVPNSNILSNHTINYSSSSQELGLLINATVTIGYDVKWAKVHELLLQSAQMTAEIDTDRQPFVLQKELNDFYVSYEINAYTRKPERMYFITSELLQHIQDTFKEAGIEIMSPQQIHIKP